jgi:hypothetical protein
MTTKEKTREKTSRKEIVAKAVDILESHLEALPPAEGKRRRKALHALVTSESEAGHKVPQVVETSRNHR